MPKDQFINPCGEQHDSQWIEARNRRFCSQSRRHLRPMEKSVVGVMQSVASDIQSGENDEWSDGLGRQNLAEMAATNSPGKAGSRKENRKETVEELYSIIE